MCLYFMTNTKHHHNLRGTCGQSFGCLKSQFRSKLSCTAVSIPKIIGEALPYISCISRVLWRPNCFCGSCAASSEPAKYKVIKLQCQHKLDLLTWWSTPPPSLVAILVSSVYSTCALNCHCNNSTDYSPSEGNTHSPKIPRESEGFMAVQMRTPFPWVWHSATWYLVPDVSKEHSAFIFLCPQVCSRLRVQKSKNYSWTS